MEAVKGLHFSCLFKNTYFMSNIIDSIRLSGVTYTIQGSGGGGNPTVELTQAQYDALVTAGTVQADTYYIITDAQGGDLSNYMTSAQTMSAITEATSGKADTTAVTQSITEATSGKVDSNVYTAYTASTDTAIQGKQDTLVSGTNIKTINNESLLGSGNIDVQGGGGTIDPSLDSGSTNAVANSAITTAFNSCYGNGTYWDMVGSPRKNIPLRMKKYGTNSYDDVTLNLGSNLVYGSEGFKTLSVSGVVETSAITTAITSSSTDAQVPSAKAVNDKLGGLSVVKLTESEYTALVTKDSNTLYVVVPDPSN